MSGGAESIEVVAARDSLASRFGRLRRWSGYAAWSAAATALPIALDRLVIAPVLNRALPEESFGAFIWVLGIMTMVSTAGGAGFSNLLMRELARREPDDARTLFRTVVTICAVTSALFVGGAAALSYFGAVDAVRRHAPELCGVLAIYGWAGVLQWLPTAHLRVRRRFDVFFWLRAMQAGILALALFAARGAGLMTVCVIYAASQIAPAALNFYLVRADVGRGSWYVGAVARTVWIMWPGLALSAVIESSLVYAPRIVLGMVNADIHAVTILFIATSIGSIFTMPVSIFGSIVLAALAGHRDFALAGRKGWAYLAFCLGVGAAMGVASDVIGRPVIRMLYPDDAAAALGFYHWVALANAAGAGVVLVRPVVLRYARVRHVALLSVGTLAVQLAFLFVFVPLWGCVGAAQALTISGGLGMLMWGWCYVGLLRDGRRDELSSAAGPVGVESESA